jgi:hypothetical protein
MPVLPQFAVAPEKNGGGLAVRYDLSGPDTCLLDHVIDGRPLFPAMGHVVTIWRALDPELASPLHLKDLEVLKPVGLTPGTELEFHVVKHESAVSVLLGEDVVARARLGTSADPMSPVTPLAADAPVLHAGQVYGLFKRYGYEYAERFALVQRRSIPGTALGAAEMAPVQSSSQLVAYLDCVLQLMLERLGVLRLPTLLRELTVLPSVVTACGMAPTHARTVSGATQPCAQWQTVTLT